jgi:transposase
MDAQIIKKADLVWKYLEPHLPKRKAQTKGGRPWHDDYPCVLGIVWVLVTGAQWNQLPKELGVSDSTCWRRHRDWSAQGIWLKAWQAALAQLEGKRPRAAKTSMVDGMFVRARKGGI